MPLRKKTFLLFNAYSQFNSFLQTSSYIFSLMLHCATWLVSQSDFRRRYRDLRRCVIYTIAVSAATDIFVSYTPSMIANVLRPAKSQH